MKKIDKSLLPSGYNTDKSKDGFYAEFYEDGQLSHYGFYVDGELEDRWVLSIDHDMPQARAQRQVTLEYSPDEEESVNNGHHVPTEDEEESNDFIDFVEYWIERINQDGDAPLPRCSFCEKGSNEVKKLIAGPTTYICSECVEFCQEILAEEEASGDDEE